MKSQPPAVILGGAANAVSVARSLAAAAVPVYALGTGGWDPVQYSRACRGYFGVDGGGDVQGRWLEWLERGVDGAVLLPCNDDGLELIAANRALLLQWGYRPFVANDEVLRAMLDKSATYAIAGKIGIETPRTVTIGSREGLDAATVSIGFPYALKPIHSHLFARHFKRKVIVVRDEGELDEAWGSLAPLGLEVLATEIIPGGDDRFVSYYTYIDEQGEPVFHFTKCKLRQFPTGFGCGCYEATRWDAEVAALGLRFFQGAGVRGLANVEFKRDARDGRLKLIECNHRFTASNEIVRIAGIDLALLVYNRLVGRPDPPVDSFRDRVYLWQPIEDVRSFLSSRRRGEATFTGWVASLLHRQYFPVFRWDDPMPSVTNVRRAISLLRSWLPRALRPHARSRSLESRIT